MCKELDIPLTTKNSAGSKRKKRKEKKRKEKKGKERKIKKKEAGREQKRRKGRKNKTKKSNKGTHSSFFNRGKYYVFHQWEMLCLLFLPYQPKHETYSFFSSSFSSSSFSSPSSLFALHFSFSSSSPFLFLFLIFPPSPAVVKNTWGVTALNQVWRCS